MPFPANMSGSLGLGHHCHWPGCKVEVPPSMWGCSQHWYKLPRPIRNRIWAAYRPGQEIRKDPSESYLRAADAAQAWIRANSHDGIWPVKGPIDA